MTRKQAMASGELLLSVTEGRDNPLSIVRELEVRYQQAVKHCCYIARGDNQVN